jgi:hypothetical protein
VADRRPRAVLSGSGRRWAALLVAGWLAQAAFRIWLTRDQATPAELPDAIGYLIGARWMSGGPGGHLASWFPEYQGGYPLTLVPAFWLSTNPVTVYRLVMIINGLANALVMPLAFTALRRMDVRRRPAYGLAHVAALLPAVVFYAQFPLADAVLPVVVLGWLILLHRWLTTGTDRGALWFGAAASLAAAYAYTVHGRGAVVAALQLAVAVIAGFRGWVPRRAAALAAAALCAGVAIGYALNVVLLRNYPHGSLPLRPALIAHTTSIHGLLVTTEWTAGKVWYQLAATAGVGALGLTGLGVTVARRQAERAQRVLAAVVLAATLGIAAATSAALPDLRRADTWVNGRYLVPLTLPLFLVGAAMLVRLRPRLLARYLAAAAALTAVLTAAVLAGAGGRLTRSWFSDDSFPEISFLTQSWTSLHLVRAAAVAVAVLACACLAMAAGRAARAAALAGAAALAVAAVLAITSHITGPSQAAGPERQAASLTRVLHPPGPVVVDSRLGWHLWVLEQYEVTWAGVSLADVRGRPSRLGPARVAVLAWRGRAARESWPAAPSGWRVAASDRLDGWVVWRRMPVAGASRAPLAARPAGDRRAGGQLTRETS